MTKWDGLVQNGRMRMVKDNEMMQFDISDDVYEALRWSADKNRRSISAGFEALIQKHIGVPIQREGMRVQFILDGNARKKIPARMTSA
jgi:hypothetical protein